MEACFRCDRTEEQVKLVDVIYRNEIVKVCEECVLTEDFPIIRKPTTSQLKETDKTIGVRERLKRLSGIKEEKKQDISEVARKVLFKEVEKEKDRKFGSIIERVRARNKPLNLIENYNWHILLARKKRKLTRSQLAKILGEGEVAIKMIENKELPDDALMLIKKLEQYFGIRLRKLEVIEKEEKTNIEEVKIEEPARILKFEREAVKNITIGDLVKMKKPVEETKITEEKIEIKLNEKKSKAGIGDMIWQLKKRREEKLEENFEEEPADFEEEQEDYD